MAQTLLFICLGFCFVAAARGFECYECSAFGGDSLNCDDPLNTTAEFTKKVNCYGSCTVVTKYWENQKMDVARYCRSEKHATGCVTGEPVQGYTNRTLTRCFCNEPLCNFISTFQPTTQFIAPTTPRSGAVTFAGGVLAVFLGSFAARCL
ncbi:hypothetical protein BV898_11732 [Hypsibius exemplaris]|uniref:Protein quiver n=1 Tax=Hypsibius exemplaris TaxID=2072580 RepID=A0A1W0WFV8_HYPEX|nr:hypothetical protein BV898_11732 [Hypsibius exemplaris]